MAEVVQAAGGIVYRQRTDFQGWLKFSDDGLPPVGSAPQSLFDNLEVCVVHRPKYDDWSWPKGKLNANESHRRAAVREIGEETGVCVALGPKLGEEEYPLNMEGKDVRHSKDNAISRKHVVYWMARPLDDLGAACTANTTAASATGPAGPKLRTSALTTTHHPTDPTEIDHTAWVSVECARHLLTHPMDRDMLDLFVDKVEEGAAYAGALIIARHAKAEPRKLWQGGEGDRPITPRGSAAAYALASELACLNPTRLVTSPWTRCIQTFETFSTQSEIPLHTAQELTEDAFSSDPEAAWRRCSREIDRALSHRTTTALCMHRPVIGGVFDHLRTLCATRSLTSRLPDSSPYMPTGNAIVLYMIGTTQGPQIIDIQKVAPLVY